MLLTISDVLDAETLGLIQTRAPGLKWKDGTSTAGASARRVKKNEQASLATEHASELRIALEDAIQTHPVLTAAAQPRRYSAFLLSRTNAGGGYGLHIDNALMGKGASRLRSDLSFTLFLSDPDSYTGGELTIEHPGFSQALKPNAGDLVLYPSTSLHHVAPVTSGTRLACIGWIESLVPDAAQREILFDLENLRADLRAAMSPEAPELLTLSKSIANLLRLWVKP